MRPFSFEHSFKFDEELYVRLNSLFTRKSKLVRITLAILFGISCLFWQYSFLLGITVLILVAISIFMPRVLPQTVAKNFRAINYLKQELTYGVNENNLWVKGEDINVELGWQNAAVWDIREEWLRISPNHSPALWFEIGKLKEANVYENVIALCNKHAVRYNSKVRKIK